MIGILFGICLTGWAIWKIKQLNKLKQLSHELEKDELWLQIAIDVHFEQHKKYSKYTSKFISMCHDLHMLERGDIAVKNRRSFRNRLYKLSIKDSIYKKPIYFNQRNND